MLNLVSGPIQALANNWQLWLGGIVAIGSLAGGWDIGAHIVQAKWDAEKTKQQAQLIAQITAAEQRRTEDQADANAREQALASQLLAQIATSNELNKRLQNETKNPIYHSCIPPFNGVQLYNAAASATKGSTAGQ